MKRTLTKQYMTVFFLSIIAIIFIWLLLTYVFVFSGKGVGKNQPQYLVNEFEQYVVQEDVVSISEEGQKIIRDNHLWVQIINSDGLVLTEYNTYKLLLPQKYNVFEISRDILYSNVVEGQTLFIGNFASNPDLGVIIGCDSSRISKWNVKISGGNMSAVVESLTIFLIVNFVVGMIAGIIYSKKISEPVVAIIENIDSLEKDKELIYIDKKNIYHLVFESIENLQKRLNEAKCERNKMEKQREEWISNISHDIKTPLTTIRGYAEIMSDEDYSLTEEEKRKYSKIIERNVNVIEGLIKDLNFSRLFKEGKIVMKEEPVNVCRLLRQCCDDMYSRYDNKIDISLEDEDITVCGDEDYLRRVFINIICNAFIHNDSDVQLSINCKQTQENVRVEIIDDGKGMDQEEQEKIFSRYYRGKASTEIDGSGLGLAIAYEIIKAHRGNIEVESEKNKGTKFTISLNK